MEDDWGRT
jgi:hypothetical protein